jgi:hypothetical protein
MERQNPVLALGKRNEMSLALDRIAARADLRFRSNPDSAIGGHARRVAHSACRLSTRSEQSCTVLVAVLAAEGAGYLYR